MKKRKGNSPEVREFIRKHSDLFWYLRQDAKENISHEVLVEFILNYGNEKTIKKLFDLLGVKYVAGIFRKQTAHGKRINYFPEIRQYFNMYFDRHAPSNTHYQPNQNSSSYQTFQQELFSCWGNGHRTSNWSSPFY